MSTLRNNVTLIGTVCSNPIHRKNQNDSTTVKFILKVARPTRDYTSETRYDNIAVQAYVREGDNENPFLNLRRGDEIVTSGHIGVGRYTDDSDKLRSFLRVELEDIEVTKETTEEATTPAVEAEIEADAEGSAVDAEN